MEQEFSDGKEISKKEVIARSPLLRAFLDPTAVEDIDSWFSGFRPFYLSIFNKIVEVLGDSDFGNEITDICDSAEKKPIFTEGTERDTELYFTSVLLSVGYEVGDIGEIGGVFGDVLFQLIDIGFVQNNFEASNFTLSTLKRGVELRKNVGRDVPQIFKDFFRDKEF